jgi:hypothetical protein
MRYSMVVLALVACTPADAAPTPEASEVRTVGAFHGLDIATVIDVEVAIGPTTRVELRGPKDWLAKLETKTDAGVLHVTMPGHQTHIPKLHAIVTTPDLATIDISGTAAVHATKLAAKALVVSVSGTGQVDLAGTADTLELTIAGTGAVMAKDLVTATTMLDVSGTAQATIHATKLADVRVSGTGSFNVLGNPVIHKHVTGVAAFTP